MLPPYNFYSFATPSIHLISIYAIRAELRIQEEYIRKMNTDDAIFWFSRGIQLYF